MSAAKHTPGPWHLTSQDDYPTGEVSADPMGVRNIVTTYGDCAKADARLIAAAPELLEALRRFERVALDTVYANNATEAKLAIRSLNSEIGRARAAIAKATGSAS